MEKEEGRRTAVNCKDDRRRHQGGLILVRTDDPSSPDDNAICDKLIKEIRETSQIMGCIAACIDVDEKNGTEHR